MKSYPAECWADVRISILNGQLVVWDHGQPVGSFDTEKDAMDCIQRRGHMAFLKDRMTSHADPEVRERAKQELEALEAIEKMGSDA